jgi:hypothetical protein
MENSSTAQSYVAMMESLGKLLVGDEKVIPGENVIRNQTNWRLVQFDWDRKEAVQAGLEQLFQKSGFASIYHHRSVP